MQKIIKVDLLMIKGLPIIDHLLAHLFQDFKHEIENNFYFEDKKRKVIKQFSKTQESCKNRRFGHVYSPEKDTLDYLLDTSSGVALYDEFLTLLEFLKEFYSVEKIVFEVDESNIINGKDYLKEYEYKKLRENGVDFLR